MKHSVLVLSIVGLFSFSASDAEELSNVVITPEVVFDIAEVEIQNLALGKEIENVGDCYKGLTGGSLFSAWSCSTVAVPTSASLRLIGFLEAGKDVDKLRSDEALRISIEIKKNLQAAGGGGTTGGGD